MKLGEFVGIIKGLRIRQRADELRRVEVQKAKLEKIREAAAEKLQKAVKKTKKSCELYQLPFLAYQTLAKIAKRESVTYQAAEPFPHIALEGLFGRPIVRMVADEVSQMELDALHKSDNEYEVKLSTDDAALFGPWTSKLLYALNSGVFLAFLERLTGINGLIADPHLRGGGVHIIRRGGKLGIHADFNHHKRLKVFRRLNLLLFLNREWDEAWGGHLELWNREQTRCCRRIAPIFNRTVIFDTSNFSYHGHPQPLECPHDECRRSLALYYYTVDCPHESDRDPHGTLFVDVPPWRARVIQSASIRTPRQHVPSTELVQAIEPSAGVAILQNRERSSQFMSPP